MAVSAANIKWKIFRALCYVQITAAVGFIAYMVMLAWPFRFPEFINVLLFLLIILIFALIAANSFSNLYLVEKYLPDQHPPRTAFKLNQVLFIFSSFAAILVIIGTILTYGDLANPNIENQMPGFPFGMLNILSVLCIPVSVMQFQLREVLTRNLKAVFDNFLNKEDE